MDEPGDEDLFERIHRGDGAARDEVFALVYDELRRIAKTRFLLAAHNTLQTTALVNEAYLKMRRANSQPNDRTHFVKLAARAMRSIVVDHSRKKKRAKRSPPGERMPLDELTDQLEKQSGPGGLTGLDEALERLEQREPMLAKLVELRFFAGCTVAEAAAALQVTERHVARLWNRARAWLRRDLGSRGAAS